MKLRHRLPLLLLALLPACGDLLTSTDQRVLESDFQTGTDGWTAGFADFPPADAEIYELQAGVRPLPAPLDSTRRGFYIAGHNRSDDLFMFLKRPVDGLVPGVVYRVRFQLDLATNAGSGCVGIGGAPGESVYLKAGATTREPVTVQQNGYLRMSIDKGEQQGSGSAMATIGDVANGSNRCDGDAPFRLKSITSDTDRTTTPPRRADLRAAADGSGRLWLIVGTDSGFEGLTRLYYARIRVELERE